MLKMVFFDLDGTLLPMDQERFVRTYFGLLAKKCEPHGYDPKALIAAIWRGTEAMIANDGSATNEAVFWKSFTDAFGERILADKWLFDDFYLHDFERVRESVGFQPMAAEAVRVARKRGFRVALATNPFFPAEATHARIRWAGLSPSDFEYCTTYEDSRFCKPDLAYYRALCERLGVAPEECLMVGNDVEEDMVAGALGMRLFLLTDCCISRTGQLPEGVPHGGFDALLPFLAAL